MAESLYVGAALQIGLVIKENESESGTAPLPTVGLLHRVQEPDKFTER